MQQIIAIGGGGFSDTPNDLRMERYIIAQARAAHPKVCFLGQATGESETYILNFYGAFIRLECVPSYLSLFALPTADIAGFLMAQDVIYVGGGNTRSLLALWREWGLDKSLLTAAQNGTVLAGVSAGANCWFEAATTDALPGNLTAVNCLGYLKGSYSPHYDGEAERRPTFQRLIGAGELMPGHAFDNDAAGHFVDGVLKQTISTRPAAKGYYVDRVDGVAHETVLNTQILSE